MPRSTALSLGLISSIKGIWSTSRVTGCVADQMGIATAEPISKLLEYTGISVSDAFASQAVRKIGIYEEKMNIKGRAIALGHPLGATGTR